MKTLKYFIMLLILFLLTGCDILSLSPVEFLIDDNIKIPISEYDTYDWSKVITVKYNNLIVDFSNVNVKKISGSIEVGESCLHEVSYQTDFKLHTKKFNVLIINKNFKVKELFNKSQGDVATKGTVTKINEVGFILTDETGSIFIHKENANNLFIENETIYLNAVINNGNISYVSHEIIEENTNINIPININSSSELSDFINHSKNKTSFIRIEGTISKQENDLIIYSNYNNKELTLRFNKNALNEYTIINNLLNKKVILSGWVYDDNNFILNNVDHIYEEITSGNKPIIKTESDYYCYYSEKNVSNLLSYFKITDDEDKSITPTETMIQGNTSNRVNVITLKVIDSDNNVSFSNIIIEINNYVGIETKESISVIDPYCMPTTGDINVLVIPVNLSKSPANEEMRTNIEKAFFGTEYETGWESLHSYYQESSNNKLNISGTVTKWYTPKYSSKYYVNYSDDDNYISGSTLLMVEALKHFKNSYDYNNFDSNNDGFIDAVYIIYNNDIGGNNTSSESDFYWAYTYWDFNAPNRSYDDTLGYGYVFMGYDFFMENLAYSSQKLKLNCETLIHETGHLLNLEDYYDYDEYDKYSNDGGYCGSDMMEYNFGDHGPYSKILLDWINPIEITKSGIYELPAFSTSGITFIIGANGYIDSIFDEYYLIDFYHFDGLNKLQNNAFYSTNNNYAGVRVSHVDANLTYEAGYFPSFTYNNTDTKHKQIKMLEADYKGRFDLNNSDNTGAKLSDFYKVGDTFGTNQYSYYKSHKNNNIPFTMKVIKIEGNIATVEITIK